MIRAEQLHNHVGTNAAALGHNNSWIPFTIGEVRYHPESNLIIVRPTTPTPAIVEFGFVPDAPVLIGVSRG